MARMLSCISTLIFNIKEKERKNIIISYNKEGEKNERPVIVIKSCKLLQTFYCLENVVMLLNGGDVDHV